MENSSSSPTQPGISPGLLITHDWRQIHTKRGFLNTVIHKVDSSTEKNYETVTFPITTACQYQAFVNGLGSRGVNGVKSCPLQLISEHVDQCETCYDRPLSAIVRMISQTTHVESICKQESFSAEAETALKGIMEYAAMKDDAIARQEAGKFLQKFGSHGICSTQKLGKCFYWVGLVEAQCNMEILREITDELFTICEEKAVNISASEEGEWYSPQDFVKCDTWTEEKKDIVKALKLQVAHCGSSRTSMNLKEWKESKVVDQLIRLKDVNVNIVPAWELIRKYEKLFIPADWLANIIEGRWNEMVSRSVVVKNLRQWDRLVKEYDLQNYFSGKLSLQTVRSLLMKSAEAPRKQDLPWEIMQQIILMNSNCRENAICIFADMLPKQNAFEAMLHRSQVTKSIESFPHPMDMMLLLFMCSDFMLRQAFALKLFMCQLAIPFIVPTPDEKIETLLWPLRSVVLEWQNQKHEAMEEALVKCNLHMVAFMRLGKTTFSKSKMMNAILSRSGHSVFFHKDAPCGREKRFISNGTVEMSHFLPSGDKQDIFKEPALFFNLRGDATDYQVQYSILMDLASVLVIIVDMGDVYTRKKEMQHMRSKIRKNLILVLTNTTGLSEEDTAQAGKILLDWIGEEDQKDTFIPTFEGWSPRNDSEMTQDIIRAVRNKMVNSPKHIVEGIGNLTSKCTVDEIENSDCCNGKRIANDIVSDMCKFEIHERKDKLLPQQGESLHEMRKCIRNLHRNSKKDESQSDKEKIKSQMTAIRKRQFHSSQANSFIGKVISVFEDSPKTQTFAIRWLQLELDAISRSHLPQLHRDKNKKWHDLKKARTENSPRCDDLEQDLHQAEKQISAATCGLEHLMREMAQMHDVATHVKCDQKDQFKHVSNLPAMVARMLLEGHPTELMDGDHGVLPLPWIKAVFNAVAEHIGRDKTVFVLSIMGIQSSGKSTLLNTMFGLQFSVSAGRCTRGIYAQLIPAAEGSNLPFDYMLVLDTEGLRAQGANHTLEHDNEMATLIIGLADLTLINIKGESVAEVKDILQITVHAFLRMNKADSSHRRQCMFIHQNVSATNAEAKLAADRQQLQDELDKMTKEASEALGLPETITAFSRIINFDCQCDVVYFSDIWHGNPPMATINQGYSTCAGTTRQIILEQAKQNFPRCIALSDFPQEVEDMWNGVLADDFIFSFRNSLAAKAYIEMEQEYSRQTLKTEENLSLWVNHDCNIQIQNCTSEHDLDNCIMELHKSLKQRVDDLLTKELESLKKFFQNHRARNIIIEWKSEKEISFKLFCEIEESRVLTQMDNMKRRHIFKLRQKSTFYDRDLQIKNQAVSLAEKLRGKCPSHDELRDQFDSIWNPFKNRLISDYRLPPSNVIAELGDILRAKLSSMGFDMYLNDQYKLTPLVPDASLNTITQKDISKDHLMVKSTDERVSATKAEAKLAACSRVSFMETAAEQANDMMDVVAKKVQEMCEQAVMFHKLDGRHTLDLAVKEVMDHNAVLEAKFSFTPRFIAFFVVRVACYAAAHFDNMNQRFEERHGVQAKLNDYRQRVFLLFKNTAEEKAAEIILAANVCEAIRGPLLESIRIKLDLRVEKEIYQRIGMSKYDLITKMLDEFLQERSFTKLFKYVHDPCESARLWVQEFGNDLIFGKTGGEIHYRKFANCYTDEIITEVKKSTKAASQEALKAPETDQTRLSVTNQPSTPARNQPSAPARDQQSTPARDQQSTPARNQPSTPTRNRPSTPVRNRPSTPARDQQSTPARDQRSTPVRNWPSTPARDRPSTPVRNQPSSYTRARGRPSTAVKDQPSTPALNKPSLPARKPSPPARVQPIFPVFQPIKKKKKRKKKRKKKKSSSEKDQESISEISTPETDQHSIWIRTFCERMNSIAPIDPISLEVTKNYKIHNFSHFQEALEQSLQKLEEDMKEEFLQATAETVEWADVKDPFQKVFERLWGCSHHCPWCSEPCLHSNQNHKASHRCIQHRPPGIRGSNHDKTEYLFTNTCSVEVTTDMEYNCQAHEKQCRKTPHCSATGDEEVFHPCREYKKFLPNWDIAPDPADESSKFWQWAMCTFQEELLTEYKGTKLKIPDSWKYVTEKEASDSLRKYFQ